MVSYVEVKQYTTLQRVAEWLGLKRHAENRYDCPHAEHGKRAITFTPNWRNKDGTYGRFKCWSCNVSGDLIALTSHINKTDDVKSAKELMREFHGYQPADKGLTADAAKKIDGELVFDHPAVQALGLSPERAKQLNIGFRSRGTKSNCVLIPIRTEKGELVDYAGYSVDKGLFFSKRMAS